MKRFLLRIFFLALIVFGLAGGVFASYRAYRESERNKQVAAEILALENEANRIDQENRKLRDRIEYLQSDNFREEEAKRVLEYQKSNEKVVIIRDHAGTSGAATPPDAASNDSPLVLGVSREEEPNPIKWWHEFFRSNILL